jgi:site-specific recombinase
MQRISAVLQRNLGAWATSIVLGCLLGFTPVLGHYFGLPLDIRHVTLSLARSRWQLRASVRKPGPGLALHSRCRNCRCLCTQLFVSFTIVGIVALRAYDVTLFEQLSILRYLVREGLKSPLKFILPPMRSADLSVKHEVAA